MDGSFHVPDHPKEGISQCEMPPASIGGGNKPVSVAGVNPPLRYTLREDAQGFGLEDVSLR